MDPNNQQPFTSITPPVEPQPPITSPEIPQQATQFAQASVQPPAPVGEDPGKGLAIAGIILAFFAALIGLILSIIAKKKSKAAGFDGKLATIGIILNIVLLILSLLITIAVVSLIFLTAAKGIQERSKTSEAQPIASSIIKKAELYNVTKNSYPATLADFESSEETSLNAYKENISSTPITSLSDKVAVYTCGEDGIKTEHWSSLFNEKAELYAGFTSGLSDCTLMQ